MKVKIIGYTQPHSDFVMNFEAQDLIAFCARVSNPSNQMNTETTDKLLSYLMKHKHWSPFEMVSLTLEIETTRDIARQILRHRSFSFQEFSQRYADPTKELDFVIRDARLQDMKNRQNSIVLDSSTASEQLKQEWQQKQQMVIDTAKNAYQWAVSNGIAKEQARSVLPEGLTISRMYMAGTLRSFIHYIDVRSDVSTQLEHREIAMAVAEAISKIFPLPQ